jgi:hypothetical protein
MWGVVSTACVVILFLFPTFENTDYTEPHVQHRPQRKRRCELLDVTQCLPNLSLPPLRTTHIQQELWTYKKDRAFSMIPTEAINTLYHDDLDVHHNKACSPLSD